MADGPKTAELYAFNMGFGDCFLLRFDYGAKKKHVLIDFGTMQKPDGAPKDLELEIAKKIKELCNDKLDIVVATHRHRDHVSGFATKDGKGSGDIIRSLKPDLVLQPWTEDPAVPKNAEEPNHAFRKSLAAMSDVAEAAHRFADGKGARDERLRALKVIGLDNIANKSAVENLMKMGEDGKGRYLKAGDAVALGRILPGVTMTVMGPPSVKQWPDVRKQAETIRGEYWFKRGAMARKANKEGKEGKESKEDKALFPKEPKVPAYALWVAGRARDAEAEALHSIVRTLDDAMNNTSLILLFEAGGKKLLFPGDAQGENWAYALSRTDDWVPMLEDVDLYKVGHHGSRNATPKSLWAKFSHRGPSTDKGRMKSVMSTKHGVHGESTATAVPRSTLVTALKRETDHVTTEGISDLFVMTSMKLS